jgi:hypothetical protein
MRTPEIPQNNRPGAGFFVPFFHLVAASICKAFGRLAVAPRSTTCQRVLSGLTE